MLTAISALRVVEVRLTEQDPGHARWNPLVWFPAKHMQSVIITVQCLWQHREQQPVYMCCMCMPLHSMQKPESVLASSCMLSGRMVARLIGDKQTLCVRGLVVEWDAKPICMTEAHLGRYQAGTVCSCMKSCLMHDPKPTSMWSSLLQFSLPDTKHVHAMIAL